MYYLWKKNSTQKLERCLFHKWSCFKIEQFNQMENKIRQIGFDRKVILLLQIYVLWRSLSKCILPLKYTIIYLFREQCDSCNFSSIVRVYNVLAQLQSQIFLAHVRQDQQSILSHNKLLDCFKIHRPRQLLTWPFYNCKQISMINTFKKSCTIIFMFINFFVY